MRLLAYFKHPPEYVKFGIAEIKSLFSLHNIPPEDLFDFPNQDLVEVAKKQPYLIKEETFPAFPFVYLKDQKDEVLKDVISRAILIKSFVKIFSEGQSHEELIENLNREEIQPYLDDTGPFSFIVEPHERTHDYQTQMNTINKFGVLPFKGYVRIKNPKYTYYIYEDWENDHKLNYKLKKMYFGVELYKSLKGVNNINAKYELKDRAYLGPTSCDNDLAFLMANISGVQKDDFVLDPFLGTGGLLIPPSHFGAHCYGGEIDARVLHGYGVGRLNKQSKYKLKEGEKPNIYLNFKQYGFEQPEIFRMDASQMKFARGGYFDVIVCDPPYGWRATVRSQGLSESRKDKHHKKMEKLVKEEEQQKNNSSDENEQNQVQQDQNQSETQEQSTQQNEEVKISDNETNEKSQNIEAGSEQLEIDEEELQKQKELILKENKEQNIQLTEIELIQKAREIIERKRQVRRENEQSYPLYLILSFVKNTSLLKASGVTIQPLKPFYRKNGFIMPTKIGNRDDVVIGVLDLANQLLKPGGKISFLYPFDKENKHLTILNAIPKHESFELVDFCENVCSWRRSRICVTMQKKQISKTEQSSL